jgi:hypothetical protein
MTAKESIAEQALDPTRRYQHPLSCIAAGH